MTVQLTSTVLLETYTSDFPGHAILSDAPSGILVLAIIRPTDIKDNNKTRVDVFVHHPSNPRFDVNNPDFSGTTSFKSIVVQMAKAGKDIILTASTHDTNHANYHPDGTRDVKIEKIVIPNVFPA